MSDVGRIGILGGTLDPIHLGHIDAALAAREALHLERILIVPAHLPPHRAKPSTSPFHRFAMASLAVNGLDGFAVSDVELTSATTSYTADTLLHLHDTMQLRSSQIFFITGADAFADIETWSRYPSVLDLAHFVVVSRPGSPVGALRSRLPQLKHRMRLPIGSAALLGRTEEEGTAIFLVDAPTTDVSSTEIRQRVADGLPLHGLVAPGVEHHIQQHGLYTQRSVLSSSADHLHGQN